MEKKDLVANESEVVSDEAETTPLVTESKEETGTLDSTQKSSLSHLASELSELSLEAANKATSIVECISSGQEAEVATPESNQSADEVEEMVVDQDVDLLEPQVEEPQDQDRSETESPLESESVNTRWLDGTMLILVLEVLLLAFPISMAYYGVAYFRDCEGGDKLPMLLIILGFLSSLTLIGRILINVAKKLSFYDSNIFPSMAIFSGEFIVIVLFIAEVVYLFTMDTSLCNEAFYQYVFYMNNIAAAFVVILIFYNMKKLARCVRILRS